MLRRRMMNGNSKLILTREFTSSTNWTVPAGCKKVDVFLVGGGGSGSYSGGGGGYTQTFFKIPVVPGESIPIVVGAGGIGGHYIHNRQPGGYSQFKSPTYRANGGDCPSEYTGINHPGGNGGSGGGCFSVEYRGDGGLHGGNGVGATGAYGKGQGKTTQAFEESTGKYYSPGGGGGTMGRGYEGAGSGTAPPPGGESYGTPGSPNTGGGGGGGAHGGANGGSGIVIVRGYK